MSADFQCVVRKAELLLYEIARLECDGPLLEFVHKYRIRVVGTECQPGEEVSRVSLVFRGRPIIVPLQLAPLLLFDFLGRCRHVPQSASQIERAMRRSDFYRNHGRNGGLVSARRFSRSAIKEYVKRIREALAKAFEDTGLPLNPREVLLSQTQRGGEVLYRLKAAVMWSHIDEIYPSEKRGW